MHLVVVLAVILVACGGAPPVAPAAGPSCADAARRLVELAEADNAATAAPTLAAGITREAMRQCTDTPWSAARRACLVTARTQDATLACPTR